MVKTFWSATSALIPNYYKHPEEMEICKQNHKQNLKFQ